MAETSINNHAAFICSVADLLRGDHKQSEDGKVILPLTVLRRLDYLRELANPAAEVTRRCVRAVARWPALVAVGSGARAGSRTHPVRPLTSLGFRTTHGSCSSVGAHPATLRQDGIDRPEPGAAGGASGNRHVEPPRGQPAPCRAWNLDVERMLWITRSRHSGMPRCLGGRPGALR